MRFDFEKREAPSLNESKLQALLEERKLKRQTFTLAFAGFLVQCALWLLSAMVYEASPVLSILCVLYAVFSFAASLILAGILHKKTIPAYRRMMK